MVTKCSENDNKIARGVAELFLPFSPKISLLPVLSQLHTIALLTLFYPVLGQTRFPA